MTQPMRLFRWSAAALFLVLACPALAGNPRMSECNRQSAGKKGDERKKFMSECLGSHETTPQERMKECNVKARGMKGADRKTFMSSCLKK